MKDEPSKPDIVHRWHSDEPDILGVELWTVIVHALRKSGEEILGWGWVLIHTPNAPVATACFHQEDATTLLRTLYSAFAALHDPDDYLKQVGLDWTRTARPPSAAIVGSAKGHGSVQVQVDWSGAQRYSTIMVYPPDSPGIQVTIGIESIAHLVQLTTAAFNSLDWPMPP